MEQLLSSWTNLGIRRQVIVGLTTVGVFLGVLMMGRSAVTPDFALLYSGLDGAASGEVIAALEQQGVPHEIVGTAIRVPRDQRDRLRLVLAGEGLPANGAAGYELLDSLSGFGTTSQMFDAAYWRAKEGELSRTIAANPGIRAARVHISNRAQRPFDRSEGATASVNVTPATTGISSAQARALRFLVASAVTGLSADSVTVINGSTGEIVEAGTNAAGQRAASDRASAYRANLLRLLEAHVGVGNAVVEVNVETVAQTETIVERRFDPDSRVAISSDTIERSANASGSDTGTVSVASNLPDGDAAAGGSDQQSNDNETRERINYEVSETTREVLRAPGAVSKISVAVLVNGLPDDGSGVWRARPQDELEALQALVASTIGYDEGRGDTITLHSLPLTSPIVNAPEVVPSGLFAPGQLSPMALIQMALMAIVVLVLALFVLRPALLRGGLAPTRANPGLDDSGPLEPSAAQAPSMANGQGQLPNLASPLAEPFAQPLPVMAEDGGPLPQMAVGEFAFPDDTTPPPPPPPIPVDAEAVARLRGLIADRREETLEVLRGWMETIDDRDNEAAR